MANRTSAADKVENLAIGEMALLKPEVSTPKKRSAEKSVARSRPVRSSPQDQRSVVESQNPPVVRAVPEGLSDTLLRAEVHLPEDVIQRAKGLLRPNKTGANRTLSAPLLLQAYIRAVDSLGLNIDTRGLDRGMEEEATKRVRDALAQAPRR